MGACVALRADDVHGDELRRALAVADDLLGKIDAQVGQRRLKGAGSGVVNGGARRSEEHTSELQSLMRLSYAVFCLNKHYSHKCAYLMPYTTCKHDVH